MLKKVLEKFPDSISQSLRETAETYQKEKNLCAVGGVLPEKMEDYCVAKFEHEKISVLRLPSLDIEMELSDQEALVIAVYSINYLAPFYVPTGLIFIRLEKSRKMQDISEELKTLQFKITDIPKYALHSGWIEHLSGKTDEALSELSQIKGLKDIENIEPQMLSVRQLRQEKYPPL